MTNLIKNIKDVPAATIASIKSDYAIGNGPHTIRYDYDVSIPVINQIVGNGVRIKLSGAIGGFQ